MKQPPVSSARVVFKGRCPRCGHGKLYGGFLTIVDQCSNCRLPLREHEQGDGPAFLAILIVGALTGIFAAIFEIKYEPPYWLHAAIWIPFVVIGSLLFLRWCKAALILVQYLSGRLTD